MAMAIDASPAMASRAWRMAAAAAAWMRAAFSRAFSFLRPLLRFCALRRVAGATGLPDRRPGEAGLVGAPGMKGRRVGPP